MGRANTAARYREAAKRLHHRDGEIEIDDTAKVCGPSPDGGRYVAAWVWVPDEEAEKKPCGCCWHMRDTRACAAGSHGRCEGCGGDD